MGRWFAPQYTLKKKILLSPPFFFHDPPIHHFFDVFFFLPELSQNTSEEIVLAVVGSKSDLYYAQPPDQRQSHVPKAAQAYAQQIGAMYMETSAKTGKGIEDLFNELTKRIIERKLIKIPDPSTGTNPPGGQQPEPSVIRLDENVVDEPNDKKGCKC